MKRYTRVLYKVLNYRKGNGRPLRDPETALEVLSLKEEGFSDSQIADRFGWAKQANSYSKKKRYSITVYRYRRLARQILSELDCSSTEDVRQLLRTKT